MNQLQPPKGFRDFLPAEKRARDYVAGKVKETFELFGFEPLENPTLEYASLLLGKYGKEADKLVYTFTDRGDREPFVFSVGAEHRVPSHEAEASHRGARPKG